MELSLKPLEDLSQRWKTIAERLENKPVAMTANTHRLFANELDVAISAVLTAANRQKGDKA